MLYIISPGYVRVVACDETVLVDDWNASHSDADMALARKSRAAALQRRPAPPADREPLPQHLLMAGCLAATIGRAVRA